MFLPSHYPLSWTYIYSLLGIYSCGTVKGNKKFLPNQVKKPPARVIRGQHIMFQDEKLSNLICCIWYDVKVVTMTLLLDKKCEGNKIKLENVKDNTVLYRVLFQVRFLGTCADPAKIVNVVRRVKHNYIRVNQPLISALYNHFMGGCDLFDYLR